MALLASKAANVPRKDQDTGAKILRKLQVATPEEDGMQKSVHDDIDSEPTYSELTPKGRIDGIEVPGIVRQENSPAQQMERDSSPPIVSPRVDLDNIQYQPYDNDGLHPDAAVAQASTPHSPPALRSANALDEPSDTTIPAWLGVRGPAWTELGHRMLILSYR